MTFIDNTRRNKQADAILKLVKPALLKADRADLEHFKKGGDRKSDGRFIVLSFFINCREQGYTLKQGSGPKAFEVSWAENRNSDDIVIYPFVWGDSNAKKEDDYHNKTIYLSCGSYQKAADIILGIAGI